MIDQLGYHGYGDYCFLGFSLKEEINYYHACILILGYICVIYIYMHGF